MLSDRRHRLLILTGELLLFAVLSLRWLPHPAQWTTAIPQGHESVGTVPLFNAWTIAWNIDRARHGWRGYWAAPFFHPASNPFSLCESQPHTAVLAPLESWLGLAFAYNVYLAAMLTLNGWVACRWLETVGLCGPARLFGGLFVQTLPFVHWQFGVLQLVPVWGILWTWTAVWRYCAQPGWRPALSAGLAFGFTYWLCNYYGLFLSVLLPLMAPVFLLLRQFSWSLIPHLLAAGLIAVAMIAPIARMQLQADKQHDLTRLPETLRQLSLQPRDLANAPIQRIPPLDLAPHFADELRPTWRDGLGTLTYSLSLIGVVVGLWSRSSRRSTFLMLWLAVAAFWLARGPDGFAGLAPYGWLKDWFPGLAKVRSPFRFVLFLQLALATLSSLAVDRLWPHSSTGRTSWLRRIWTTIVCGAAVTTLLETWPDRSVTCVVPRAEPAPAWCDWLRGHTEAGTPILCLPFPQGTGVEDHLDDVIWMLSGLQHHNPIVNGYAAYFPNHYRQLRPTLQSFPSSESLQAVAALGVRLYVIRRDNWEPANKNAAMRQAAELGMQQVFTDDHAEVDIWEWPADGSALLPVPTSNR